MVAALRNSLTILALGLAFVPGCDSADTVGPEGGVVESRDGRVVLEIPEGALSSDVEVTIERVDYGPDGSVGYTYEIEPRLTQLRFPARLTYDLEANAEGMESLDLAGSDMSDATLVTEKAEGWSPLADHDVDEEAGLLSASVMFFSSVAIVVEE
jgi:hypothetical protein